MRAACIARIAPPNAAALGPRALRPGQRLRRIHEPTARWRCGAPDSATRRRVWVWSDAASYHHSMCIGGYMRLACVLGSCYSVSSSTVNPRAVLQCRVAALPQAEFAGGST